MAGWTGLEPFFDRTCSNNLAKKFSFGGSAVAAEKAENH
jgi:hypothetical protein